MVTLFILRRDGGCYTPHLLHQCGLSEDQHEQRSHAQRNAAVRNATQPCATQHFVLVVVHVGSIMNIEELFLSGYS